MKTVNFTGHPVMAGINRFISRVNKSIEDSGREPFKIPEPKGGTFETELYDFKTNRLEKVKVRLNAAIPTEGHLSVYQELVRPTTEPKASRRIFEAESNYHPGSRAVGHDVIDHTGEPDVVPRGSVDHPVPRVGLSIGRNENDIAAYTAEVAVTEADLEEMDMRRERGFEPMIDFMSEKMTYLRESFEKKDDAIVWRGSDIKGSVDGYIPGIMYYFSNNPVEYNAPTPSKGFLHQAAPKAHARLGEERSLIGATYAETMQDIIPLLLHLTKDNSFRPRVCAVPNELLIYWTTNKDPANPNTDTMMITLIKEALKVWNNNEDVMFVPTNALVKGVTSGLQVRNDALLGDTLLLLDNDRKHGSIADVKKLQLKTPFVDKQNTTVQVGEAYTGGFIPRSFGAFTALYEVTGPSS